MGIEKTSKSQFVSRSSFDIFVNALFLYFSIIYVWLQTNVPVEHNDFWFYGYCGHNINAKHVFNNSTKLAKKTAKQNIKKKINKKIQALKKEEHCQSVPTLSSIFILSVNVRRI